MYLLHTSDKQILTQYTQRCCPAGPSFRGAEEFLSKLDTWFQLVLLPHQSLRRGLNICMLITDTVVNARHTQICLSRSLLRGGNTVQHPSELVNHTTVQADTLLPPSPALASPTLLPNPSALPLLLRSEPN